MKKEVKAALLAQRLLAGEFREGDEIVVDADAEGVLTFHKAGAEHETSEPVAA